MVLYVDSSEYGDGRLEVDVRVCRQLHLWTCSWKYEWKLAMLEPDSEIFELVGFWSFSRLSVSCKLTGTR